MISSQPKFEIPWVAKDASVSAAHLRPKAEVTSSLTEIGNREWKVSGAQGMVESVYYEKSSTWSRSKWPENNRHSKRLFDKF